jgi:membrane protease YdiL (CAAX protease family)
VNEPPAKSEWRIRDVVLIYILMQMLVVILFLVIPQSTPLRFFYGQVGEYLIDAAAILVLQSKYPLKLFSGIHRDKLFVFTVTGAALSILLLTMLSESGGDVRHDFENFLEQYEGIEYFVYLRFIFLAPFLEEVLFRGFFYRIIRNRYNIFWGALVSTAFFVIPHGMSAYIAVQSLIFTYAYQKTGTVWGGIIVHCLHNVVWLLMASSITS